jgi:hypothetical protein
VGIGNPNLGGLGNPIEFPFLPLSGGTMTGDLTLAAAGKLIWSTRGSLSASADGVFVALDSAGTAFTKLCLGGTSASYPAIMRSGTTTQFKLADNSGFAPIQPSYVTTGTNGNFLDSAGVELYPSGVVDWAPTTAGVSPDLSVYRAGIGILTLGSGAASGTADLQLSKSLLTAGTMTETNKSLARVSLHRYDWTNAMVVALGAGGAGDIAVCTLPAKTVVLNAYVVITSPDSSANALTVAVGRTGASYIDYIVASDAKAAANTVYGDASAERGTNLTGYDLPSFTGTTTVNAHFIKTTSALNTVTGSTGSVYLLTMTLP